ncbi:hypothetical protein [Nocardioides pocheonensis]|uniref:hypothetical protein n=1 Tax=Nocardioides pocheonensis TaxID=661485 RepID=UPI0011CE5A2C|nr:hypothetical protein [Nocardioides pocheonensis]
MTTDEHGATRADRTSAAARLLEIAARNADELLGEARAEATAIVAAAQSNGDQLAESSRAQAERAIEMANAEADQLRAQAHAEAERVRTELEQTRAQQHAELEQNRTLAQAQVQELAEQRAVLESELARLRDIEKQVRDRVRRFLADQLAQIDRPALSLVVPQRGSAPHETVGRTQPRFGSPA